MVIPGRDPAGGRWKKKNGERARPLPRMLKGIVGLRYGSLPVMPHVPGEVSALLP